MYKPVWKHPNRLVHIIMCNDVPCQKTRHVISLRYVRLGLVRSEPSRTSKSGTTCLAKRQGTLFHTYCASDQHGWRIPQRKAQDLRFWLRYPPTMLVGYARSESMYLMAEAIRYILPLLHERPTNLDARWRNQKHLERCFDRAIERPNWLGAREESTPSREETVPCVSGRMSSTRYTRYRLFTRICRISQCNMALQSA